MTITRLSIERPRITLVILGVLTVAGVGTFLNMPRDEDPGFTVRTAVVITQWPGASPERVEYLVTDKLESAIQEMPELDYLRSESTLGSSVVYVNIKTSYTEMRPIWDSLRRKVEKVENDLPDDIIGPTVNDEFGDVFGILLTLTGEDFSYRELKDLADQARDSLLALEDAAKVEIVGAQEERIFVEYNNARLAELGLSPMQLRSILSARNVIIPGGSVKVDSERIALEPTGNFESVDDLRRTVVSVPGREELLYLEDVATISRGYIDPPRSMAQSNGHDALVLAVSMRKGGDIVQLGKDVRATVAQACGGLPIGIDLQEIQFQSDEVEKKVNGFVSNLVQAIVIVGVMMLIFLGLRTGLVVASLIPMAMILCFLGMSVLDIGLDTVSLAALIIALGMLVDNGIVMSESVQVLMASGASSKDASIQSARELNISLLTSSLTTAAAFLPIYLAESSAGEYCAALFEVVTITLIGSWLLSITMIPLLCTVFIRAPKQHKDGDFYGSPFYRMYRAVLVLALRTRLTMIAIVIVLFAAAMAGFAFVPKIFFPPNERTTFTVDLALPIGTAIEDTRETAREVQQILRDRYMAGTYRSTFGEGFGVTSFAAFIGEGAPRFLLTYNPEPVRPEFASIIVNTNSRNVIDEIIPELDEDCISAFPDLETTIRPLQLGPPITNPIEIRVSGHNAERLFAIVGDIKDRLAQVPGVKNIDDNWGARSKKLLVRINQPRARRAGVTSQDIAISLQTYLSGFATTDYREGDTNIPVILRAESADRDDIRKVETVNVYAQATGRSVPLLQVADIQVVWQPAKIVRRDRFKTITIEAGLEPSMTSAQVNAAMAPWLEREQQNWGLGYSYALGGEAEESGKSQASIAEKLPIAALIIVLILVVQFNSFRRPLIILMTVPLGMIGVIVGLLIVPNMYFGFMTLLGIVSLAGVVINNAIVLLDRINVEITVNGLAPQRAVVESAQKRLRPILLTTATTIGGMIPLYLGGGPMFEPMAIVVIFGLLFATVLTLGVVPILYSLFFRVSYRGWTYPGPEPSAP